MFLITSNISRCPIIKLKKIPSVIRYVPDQCKTKAMCNRAIIENVGTLKSVSNHYKTHEMCNKAVNNYVDALEFVPDQYRLQKCVLELLIVTLIQ